MPPAESEQIKELHTQLVKSNALSLKSYFLRGIVYGIGAAIGATLFTVFLLGLITRFVGRFVDTPPEQQTEQINTIIKNIGLTY